MTRKIAVELDTSSAQLAGLSEYAAPSRVYARRRGNNRDAGNGIPNVEAAAHRTGTVNGVEWGFTTYRAWPQAWEQVRARVQMWMDEHSWWECSGYPDYEASFAERRRVVEVIDAALGAPCLTPTA